MIVQDKEHTLLIVILIKTNLKTRFKRRKSSPNLSQKTFILFKDGFQTKTKTKFKCFKSIKYKTFLFLSSQNISKKYFFYFFLSSLLLKRFSLVFRLKGFRQKKLYYFLFRNIYFFSFLYRSKSKREKTFRIKTKTISFSPETLNFYKILISF